MNSSRKMDELCHSLSVSQARIFDRSVENGIPSYFFIKSFMLSSQARDLDNLNLEGAGITEVDIFDAISEKIKIRRGELLPYDIIHFIGYFYRSAAYLHNVTSKYLFEKISPKFLVENFETLHSLAIEDAIEEVFDTLNLVTKSKEELFIELYKTIWKN